MELLTCFTTLCWFSLSMTFGIIGLNVRPVHRPFILPLIIAFAALAFRNISDRQLGVDGTEGMSMFVIIYISHITCVLCVEQHILPKKTPVPYIDWTGGYNMLFNARWLGTSRQAPNIEKSKKDESERKPSTSSSASKTAASFSLVNIKRVMHTPRAIFLRNRIISLCLFWAASSFYDYSYLKLTENGFSLDALDFLPTKQSYFRRLDSVTLRETLIRTWLVAYWVFYSVGMYTGFHDAFALFFVGIGLNEPEDWPPLFGSLNEATSLRNFWGKYWHRLVYRSYTSYGIFISKNILRLPHNGFAGKMFVNGYVFLMSGFVHALAVWQLGFSCGAWEEVHFYLYSFLAVFVEGLVLMAFKKLTKDYQVNRMLSNTIGYAWVFMFLFTTLPKSQYPKIWCTPL